MTQQIKKLERSILDNAFGLTNQLEELNNLNPVIASQVYKQVLQYFQEKNPTKSTFTIQELIDLGYLPS